jgi:hypothetical protein
MRRIDRHSVPRSQQRGAIDPTGGDFDALGNLSVGDCIKGASLQGGRLWYSWGTVSKLKTAQRFETLEEALAYYESAPDGLSLQQHARIIDALRRLGAK